MKLRLKTLEEGLKHFSSYPTISNVLSSGSPKAEKSKILGFLTTSGGMRKRSTSQPRASSVGSSLFQLPNTKNNTDIAATKKKYTSAENVLKKGIWASRSKVADSREKENEMQVNTDMNLSKFSDEREAAEIKTIVNQDEDSESKKPNDSGSHDVVSGFLYDKLQKEVINLRKSCEIKEGSLQAKDEEIKVIATAMSHSHLTLSQIELKIQDIVFSDAHEESRSTDKGHGSRVEENEKRSSC